MADLRGQRRAHAVVVRGAALHVRDAAQDRVLAARRRRLFAETGPETSRDPARKLVLDRLARGAASTRGASRAPDNGSCSRSRFTSVLSSRRKMTRSSWLLGKRIGAVGR